ncbi:MAG TPA: hypothetical protein VFC47_01750 [Caulobacteraceae bacterium]|nr:hypothetical protein [Caulobacteraceae bacterium]
MSKMASHTSGELKIDFLAITAILCLGSLGPSASARPLRATTISICDLVNAPERFSNQRVEVSGHVIGGFHGLGLVDDDCDAKGISLDIEDEIVSKRDRTPLMSAAYKTGDAGADADGKRITARFVGLFKYSPLGRINRTIVVEKIRDVKLLVVAQ